MDTPKIYRKELNFFQERLNFTAAELGGKALAAVALELEMAIKAGADTTVALHRFDSITTDTLVAMATVAAQ